MEKNLLPACAIVDRIRLDQGYTYYRITPWSFVDQTSETLIRSANATSDVDDDEQIVRC